jgi:hypothetical protein
MNRLRASRRVLAALALIGVAAGLAAAQRAVASGQSSPASAVSLSYEPTPQDKAFLDDLQRRAFRFFDEQADPITGQVRDRARTDGTTHDEAHRDVASIAATGFGLTGLCIAAERGWLPREEAERRARATVQHLAEKMPHERGWFYHFVNARTGAREWKSELSSIDTALLMAGVLTVRQCFDADRDLVRFVDVVYRRIDFKWMLNGDPNLLSMGWKPESGFLDARWKHYCELMILYLLAIGSPTQPIPGDAWYAWERPTMKFDGFTYISSADPLFVHQYSHAWVDFRGRRERRPPRIDWWENSIVATRAHRAFCRTLSKKFPRSFFGDIWGISASDGPGGYHAWGGPPPIGPLDGTVVPCAAGGSLMFTPEITLLALKTMKEKFGAKIYGRYGFTDAFNPTIDWVGPDVLGIDLGITLLSAENLVTGGVWKWFMQNPEIVTAMEKVGLAKRH